MSLFQNYTIIQILLRFIWCNHLVLLLLLVWVVLVSVLRNWIEKLMCNFCLAVWMNDSTNRLNISSIVLIRSKTIGSVEKNCQIECNESVCLKSFMCKRIWSYKNGALLPEPGLPPWNNPEVCWNVVTGFPSAPICVLLTELVCEENVCVCVWRLKRCNVYLILKC